MTSFTTRLALPRPVGGELADGPDGFNDLTDVLDPVTAVFAQGLLSARPVVGTRGRFYWATDIKQLFYDDGTTWQVASAPPELTSLPGSPAEGQTAALTVGGGRFLMRRLSGVWRCEGGSPATVQRTGGATVASGGSVVAPSDGGMSLTLIPGVWDLDWEFTSFRPVSSPAGSAITAQPQGAGLPTLLNAGTGNPESLIWFPGTALGASFAEFVHHRQSQRFTLSGDGIINERYTALNVGFTVQSRRLTATLVSV
jgi:hypothetical protein